ncbi:MAG: LolA-related protein [Thiomonas sp.]|uniref:Putative Lipoprotein localization factors LolAB n=1 Tax=mine drainage metagenome TaxID=410659 RepID=E6PKU6_9ZZZZ
MHRTHVTPASIPDRRRLLLAMVLFAAPWLALPSHAAEWNLDALMQALAQHKSGRASFVETKTMAMLDAPIESSGELRFAAPDFLEMRTLKPKPQTIILLANQLTVELGGRSHQLSLDDHPDIAVLVDSIRATLNGDRKVLQRDYVVSLSGDAAQWTLNLVPVDARARERVRAIRIDGRQGQVRSIAVQQTDGDHSLMTIRERTDP